MTIKSQSLTTRCDWCLRSASYINYHDKIWGVPIYNDQQLFRVLSLEINQAGLSYLTILNKTKDYDLAFKDFNINLVAKYDVDDINNMIKNTTIIKNYSKINAVINNANMVKSLQKKFQSFNNYLWQYVNYKPVKHRFESVHDIPTQDSLSRQIASDMKKIGFKLVGPVSIYSFLQATGIYQDHVVNCFKYEP